MREAARLSPKLLIAFEEDSGLVSTSTEHRGHSYPTLVSPQLQLSILLQPQRYIPYVIRANEYHSIYGNSTSDVVIYSYTSTANVQVARRFKLM